MDAFGALPVYLVALSVAVGAALLLNSLQGERPAAPATAEDCQTRNALGQCVPAGELA